MSSTYRLLIYCILGLTISVTHAASFDCAKAGSKIERLICADDRLGELDEQLAGTYTQLIDESSSEIASNITKTQRLWIKNVRDKCSDDACLWDAYKTRRWELAERLKDFDCLDYAQTTIEMDGCGRSKLDEFDKEMKTTFQALVKKLETPDCCDSIDHNVARALAIEAQVHWLKFREAECSGHYETISGGTLRGSFYLSCATSLTIERIKQLSHWGTVNLVLPKKSKAPSK